MSKAAKAPAPPAPETEAAPKGKNMLKWLLIGGSALLLLIAVIVGGIWVTTKMLPAAAPGRAASESEGSASHAKEGKASSESAAKSKKAASLLPLEAFIVNLEDADASRYMRLNIKLGLDSKTGAEELTKDEITMARVRDAIMRVITSQKSDQVLSKEGREKMLQSITERCNAILEETRVTEVYIQELVVQ